MDRKIIIAIAVAAIVVVGIIGATLLLSKNASGSVYYITLAPSNMNAALVSGQIDAYIAWEPYVSDSVVGGAGEILLLSEDMMPNHPCCIVAVSNDFLGSTDGTELSERFLKAHMDATDWMVDALQDPEGENYTLLVTLAMDFTLRNESVVKAALDHMIYGYAMGATFTSALEEFTQMYIDTNMTTDAALENQGYSSVNDFVNEYVDQSLLEGAVDIEPSSTILNPDSPIRLGFLNGDLHQLAQFVAQDTRVLGDQTMFEKYGVDVVNATGAPFANGGAVMTQFAAGNVDIGYLGAPPALLQHLNAGVDVTIISQANSEGSGLVVRTGSGITSVADLVNKTVATPGESSIQFLLLKITLQKEGLDLEIRT